jgi:aromatic ring hydroxylase
LQRLRTRRPSLWYRGEPVADVTAHPAFKGGVQTLAKLYDLQWEDPEVSLCDSPTTGRKIGRSFVWECRVGSHSWSSGAPSMPCAPGTVRWPS